MAYINLLRQSRKSTGVMNNIIMILGVPVSGACIVHAVLLGGLVEPLRGTEPYFMLLVAPVSTVTFYQTFSSIQTVL